MLKYNDGYHYNTVTLAQYALSMHGRYVNGTQDYDKFLVAANKLLELQNKDGSFRYSFAWRYYLLDKAYEPGWVSGMDYGQVLSVFARAYNITGDKKYVSAGNKAVEFLIKPIDEGGVMGTLKDLDPALNEYIIFEEFISSPEAYTLNGFMFSLLGLYDWSNIDSDTRQTAYEYFMKGIDTLEKILPYYDIGGFTAYDLSHITYNRPPHIGVSYHAVHIQFCDIFYQITDRRIFSDYFQKWTSYVDNR